MTHVEESLRIVADKVSNRSDKATALEFVKKACELLCGSDSESLTTERFVEICATAQEHVGLR